MTAPAPPAPVRLEAAAGAAGGSWFVLLEGLARLVHEVHPWLTLEVIQGGGVVNHARVGSGRLPAAILNPPMTRAALAGRPPFDAAFPELRVAIANLTVNHLHLMIDRRLPLDDLSEWPARACALRLPVDRVGTVDRFAFDLALAHLGVGGDDVARWGGALVPAEDYHRQLALYRDGQVDGLWQFMAIPSPSIAAAHAARPLKPVRLPAGVLAALEASGWTPAELPPGAYGAVDAPVPTVAMGTSLGFHASVPDELVHAITAAVCGRPERVRAIHPAAAAFDPRRAPLDPGGPLHAGAARFYREQGWG